MQIVYYKTLLTVVEEGSFSRAAEELNITQSAVSQRIKYIEEYLGHQILDRSGGVLVPTEVGELVLKKAMGIVEKERELAEELKRFGRKRLSLCCTPTFGMAFLPRTLNRFLRQNADLADLKFVFHQPDRAIKGLRGNEFDLAIIEHCDGFDFSHFHVEPLPEDQLVIISPPRLGIPPGEVKIEQLLPYRIYSRREGCSSRFLLKMNLAGLGRSLEDFNGVVVSDDLRFTVEAVLCGGGISFISSSLAEEHLDQGYLQVNTVEGFTHVRRRSLLVPKGRESESLLREFMCCAAEVTTS